jgi:hypothetical protein
MQSLFGAKQRVRERARSVSPPPPAEPFTAPEPPVLGQAAGQAQVLQSKAVEGEAPSSQAAVVAPKPAREPDEQPEETLAARLRRARERR